MSNQKVMVIGGIKVVEIYDNSGSCKGCCFNHNWEYTAGCLICDKCIYKKVEDVEDVDGCGFVI